MSGMTIAISGAIGTGKKALGAGLADALGGDHVGFGNEVRAMTAAAGRDPMDVAALQEIGQAMVVARCGDLVDAVLARRPASSRSCTLVVSGLRHVEVLLDIKRKRRGHGFLHVHMNAPSDVRTGRVAARTGANAATVGRYESHVCEEQNDRILPQYADVRVQGTLPLELQVAWVLRFVHPRCVA